MLREERAQAWRGKAWPGSSPNLLASLRCVQSCTWYMNKDGLIQQKKWVWETQTNNEEGGTSINIWVEDREANIRGCFFYALFKKTGRYLLNRKDHSVQLIDQFSGHQIIRAHLCSDRKDSSEAWTKNPTKTQPRPPSPLAAAATVTTYQQIARAAWDALNCVSVANVLD